MCSLDGSIVASGLPEERDQLRGGLEDARPPGAADVRVREEDEQGVVRDRLPDRGRLHAHVD